MSKCKGCGADVLWIKTEAGKNMIVEPKLVEVNLDDAGQINIVTPNGKTIARAPLGTMGYIPHWARCPRANDFKK